jgi:hypothetical protein
VNDLLTISICGWVLSILRRNEGPQYAHIRPSQHNIANTCSLNEKNGLGQSMKTIFDILDVSTVEEVIENLNLKNFASKMLAKKDLLAMWNRVKQSKDGTLSQECIPEPSKD